MFLEGIHHVLYALELHVRGVMGHVPFLNGSSSHQDSLTGLHDGSSVRNDINTRPDSANLKINDFTFAEVAAEGSALLLHAGRRDL